MGRDRWGIYSTVVRLHPLVPEVSPRRGTEGVEKTIEERLGEKVELSLQERRRGRKRPSLKEGRNDFE